MNVDRGVSANRTVVTFVGDKTSIIKGAWQGIQTAADLIDMREHKGEHPRVGAIDVCPFIPVENVNMKECVMLSRELGKKVAKLLNIPVYLYEKSAVKPGRKRLENIRRGEYEKLSIKMQDDKWKPDYGDTFNEKLGAMVTGARNFLVAYNVNLNTRDRSIAELIAGQIRESGRSIVDKNGTEKKVPGLLKNIKAVGWFIEEYGCAQVSMNLTDYTATPLYVIYETIKELARLEGTHVTGSEIVGIIPKDGLLETGSYYLEKQNKETEAEEDKIAAAIESLGLNDVQKFVPKEKILEYILEEKLAENRSEEI